MFEGDGASGEAQAMYARLTGPDALVLSAAELAELVGDCQTAKNVLDAIQVVAMARIAATEEVLAEDGTLVEEVRPVGYERLDAPSLVAGWLGISEQAAATRMRAAVTLCCGCGPVVAAMAEGRIDAYRAGIVAEEIVEAPEEVRRVVTEALAPRLGKETAGPLRRRVVRELAAVDPDAVRQRAQRLRAERYLRRFTDYLGCDRWEAALPVETARSAWAAIDRLAQDYVATGRSPGVDAARVDALLDLIHGHSTGRFEVQLAVPADQVDDLLAALDHLGDRSPGNHGSDGDSARADAPTDPADPRDVTDPADPRDVTDPADSVSPLEGVGEGHLRSAALDAARRGAQGCSSAGAGAMVAAAGCGATGSTFVPAPWLVELLRRACDPDVGTDAVPDADFDSDTDAPAVTVTVVGCDADTGARLQPPAVPGGRRRRGSLDSPGYRPSPALVALVKARDGQCRFPGCTVAARFCDLDHVRPWPAGPTSAANLVCLCRRHHRIKQRPGWTVCLLPDATLHVTDPTGQVRTSTPIDLLGRADGTPVPPTETEPQPIGSEATPHGLSGLTPVTQIDQRPEPAPSEEPVPPAMPILSEQPGQLTKANPSTPSAGPAYRPLHIWVDLEGKRAGPEEEANHYSPTVDAEGLVLPTLPVGMPTGPPRDGTMWMSAEGVVYWRAPSLDLRHHASDDQPHSTLEDALATSLARHVDTRERRSAAAHADYLARRREARQQRLNEPPPF